MTNADINTRQEPHPNAAEPAGSDSSWWVWIAWLECDAGGGFIYGCAARCFRPPGWINDSVHDIPGAGRLVVGQRTVTAQAFDAFRDALDAGSLRPELVLGPPCPEARVAETRSVIQKALGHTAARTTLHYTLPKIDDLVGPDDGALAGVLSTLQDQLNLPFKDSYAGRLGNFEIFDLNPWLDGVRPFALEVVRTPGLPRAAPETWEICRSPAFAAEKHIARFVGRVHSDVVADRLVTLEPGEPRVAITIAEPVEAIDFQLYDAAGETVLHSEQHNFITRVALALAPINRQMTIQDDLSGRAAQKDAALGVQASVIHGHTSHRSEVGGPAAGSWRRFAEQMEHRAAALSPKPSEDRWFPRGVEGEVGAIAHLNQLLNGGQVERAVLVDPWFGADALGRFVLRLGSQDLGLTIVTSWTSIDPDTGLELDLAHSPTEKLESALHKLRPFLNPRLTVINLADGKRQAFHDRYLLLYPHEGHAKAFLLSNSINNMAGDWPFSMSLFAGDASREVRRYIEGLCNGRDIARAKALTTSFKWP